MEMIILSGIQASGKSTFFNEKFSHSHTLVSLDILRNRTKESALIAELIQYKKPFVIDNTNPIPEDRARYITIGQQAGYNIVGYQIQVHLTLAIARNIKRPKPVPDFVIRSTSKRLIQLGYEEGFNEIFLVNSVADKKFNIQPIYR